MPDHGFGRCDGYHEMVEFRISGFRVRARVLLRRGASSSGGVVVRNWRNGKQEARRRGAGGSAPPRRGVTTGRDLSQRSKMGSRLPLFLRYRTRVISSRVSRGSTMRDNAAPRELLTPCAPSCHKPFGRHRARFIIPARWNALRPRCLCGIRPKVGCPACDQ
jgi:hypothetical protein